MSGDGGRDERDSRAEGSKWLLTTTFALSGGLKLAGHSYMVKNFSKVFGFPRWFLLLIGVQECAIAALLHASSKRARELAHA
eukprot:gene20761-35171_t